MDSTIINVTGFYQRLLENLSTAILVFDEQLVLDYINPAGETLLAVSVKRLRGQRLQNVLPDAAHLVRLMTEALATNHPYTERELRLTLPDLKMITVDCTVIPLSDPLQAPGLLVEITPMDRHLRIAREENLLQQHTVTRELIRGMAHEIKNPLGGLRGAAQLLERELQDDGLREYTRVIISEADRLRNLVNRLLGPNTLPNKRLINIHEVIERICQLVSAECHDGITIIRDYDPSLPELAADPDLLIQAILNIVRNAAEAMNYRGEITIRTRPLRQFTIGNIRHKLVERIEIIDNGPGIPAELREKIFYPMVSGRAEGTGLGLSIAQSIINQHQGLIECTSRPGRTTFTILLPLNPTQTEET